MESGLVGREFLCHFLRSLNHPEVEGLSLYHEVVAIAYLLLNLCNLLAWESRHDAVNECCVYTAAVVKPSLKLLWQFPELYIFVDAVFQYMSVEEYQLAREDDESLCRIAVEGLPTTIEQLHELAGI